MNRRLYFMLPNVDVAKKVVDELLLARIHDNKMHLIAKDMDSLKHLPQANVFQSTDLIHALELGLIVGGATGSICGAALSFSPGITLGFTTLVLAGTVCGALIGTWASGMIGSNMKNTRLRPFQKDIERGEILLMVDVVKERVEEITNLICSHHPSAHSEGVEPSIPAFP